MANDSQAFYEDPVAELSQGDIIHISPHSFLDPPLRSISLSDAGVPAVSDLSLSNIEGCGKIVAECRPSTALLLNYDCEIAKPTTKRLVVCPILPLAQFSPTDQGNIRRNRTAHLFFLPRFRKLPGTSSHPDCLPKNVAHLRPEKIGHYKTDRAVSLPTEKLVGFGDQSLLHCRKTPLRGHAGINHVVHQIGRPSRCISSVEGNGPLPGGVADCRR